VSFQKFNIHKFSGVIYFLSFALLILVWMLGGFSESMNGPEGSIMMKRWSDPGIFALTTFILILWVLVVMVNGMVLNIANT
jgi:succinate dehydrogenase/fumarate reductase cytochrome b subunit